MLSDLDIEELLFGVDRSPEKLRAKYPAIQESYDRLEHAKKEAEEMIKPYQEEYEILLKLYKE